MGGISSEERLENVEHCGGVHCMLLLTCAVNFGPLFCILGCNYLYKGNLC